jgi:hypothetical protein
MMNKPKTHLLGLKKLSPIMAVVFMFLTASCDVNQITATSTSIPVQFTPSTATIMDSEPITTNTIEVVPSPSPTFEQQGQLSENGPWFVYRNIDGYLIAINSDGSSRILVSNEKQPDDLVQMNGIYKTFMSPSSSDGLIAYRSVKGESNVQLTILQLPDQNRVNSFTLLSGENEQEALGIQPYPTQNLLAVVDNTPKWSPSGKYLAFIAALDGPTSDLYLYNVSSNTVTRITNDPDQVGEIHWSPDGSLIYYESILGFNSVHPGGRKTLATWSASVDGSNEIKLLDFPYSNSGIGAYQDFLGWISDDGFVINITCFFDISIRRVLVVNAINGDYDELPYVGYQDIALDPNTGTMMFSILQEGYRIANLKPGLYIGTVSGEEPLLIRDDPAEFVYWLSDISKFILCSYDELSIASSDGSIVVILEDRCELPYPSPDGQFIGLRDENEISIHTLAGDVVQEIPASTISVDYPNDLYWLPDSSGYFFKGDEIEGHGIGLYLVRPIGDESILIASDFPTSGFPMFYSDAVWVQK